MIARLAIRNIFRNRWRTGLTMAGIAVGVAMLVWTLAYLEGFKADLIRGVTAINLGQIEVTTVGNVKRPTLYHTFELTQETLEKIDAVPGVSSAAPRLVANGLVGNEKRSTVAQIIGVDPKRDEKTMNVAKSVTSGAWFPPVKKFETEDELLPRSAVIGVSLAKQLQLEVGDELVTFFEASDGSLGNDLLTVVGIVETGSSGVDRAGVFMRLEDLQMIAAADGQVHSIAVTVDHVIGSEALVTPIEKAIANAAKGDPDLGGDVIVRHWGDAAPSMYKLIGVMDYANLFYFFIIYTIVAFGLFNASRMSALERRREFAMMMAIGVPRNRLFWTVLLETVLISVIGAVIGVILGGAYSYYLSINGLDMTAFTGGEGNGFDYMGVNFSQLLYFVVTPKILVQPIIYIIPVAVLCGLWPAFQAARTDILKAISDRT